MRAGVVEARVLDLYAGTGALGLEALSRGAAHATFVESARDAVAAVRENIAALGVGGQARLVPATVEGSVTRIARVGPFDLVLVDPPWALVDTGAAARALEALAAEGAFAAGAWVVLEHSSRTEEPRIHGLHHAQSRRYGDATLAFYKTGILARPRGDT